MRSERRGIRGFQRAQVSAWLCLICMNSFGFSSLRSDDYTAKLHDSVPSVFLPGHEFDFLAGHWSVHNRLLKKRIVSSREWTELVASDEFHALPSRLGIEETYRTDEWPNYCALGLLLYDPASRRWTLYWADNRNLPGVMQTLGSGELRGRIGTFYATDRFDDKPIKVRILWELRDENHAHGEQAFSPDGGGGSWETNWTMEFSRQKT